MRKYQVLYEASAIVEAQDEKEVLDKVDEGCVDDYSRKVVAVSEIGGE